MRRSSVRAAKWSTPLLLLFPLVSLTTGNGQAGNQPADSAARYQHLSSGVVSRQYLMHPQDAPEQVRPGYEAAARAIAQAKAAGGSGPAAARTVGNLLRFNRDSLGLPQNEESVSACEQQPNLVLGGTNDYRGLLNPKGNFTGWHLSTNGGRSLANEGLLPAVQIGRRAVPSGGDPVDAIDADCTLYAASLNYPTNLDFGHLTAHTNGVAVYRTSATRLANCPGGDDPSCWPDRRAVATNGKGHFLDKEWMTAGKSGSAGRVVWVTYTDFNFADPDFPGLFTNQIKAVRCDAALRRCTNPILISGQQNSLQFSDVTIGPDGRTYITWEEDNDLANNFQPPEHMRFWLRVAEPGSTTFGPQRLVAAAPRNIGLAELHADGFRISTYPKNTVAMVHGKPRVFVTWDECKIRVLGDSVCEEPQVKLRYSDDLGRSWSSTRVVSQAGDNYFPTITGRVAVAYYTSRYDPVFHNRQDVELVTLDAGTVRLTSRQRITPFSNEPEADPLFNDGRFIGDYIEVAAQSGSAYVHFNANYVSVRLLGAGVPVPQQDNFLARVKD